MATLLNSLAAVLVVIMIGFAARRLELISESAWRGFEAVTYHVLIPALVVHTLAFAKLDGLPVLAVGGTLVAGAMIMTALLLGLRPLLAAKGIDGPAFTSVFQGSVRWNTFIALAVASQQFGSTGVALMAVLIATLIPAVNIVSVLIMSRYARGEAFDMARTLITLIKNPFIWSCALGMALNPVAAFIPTFVGNAIDVTGKGTLAAGLLLAGAGLDLSRLTRPALPHAVAVGLKLLVMPGIVYIVAQSFGLHGASISVAMIAATVPTAAASYILARQMGGDAPLMAEIATLQTLAAMITMPIILLATAL